jgi:hypothetical protein
MDVVSAALSAKGRRRGHRPWLGVVVLASLCAACGSQPLEGARPTARDLANAVLLGFERSDAATLQSLVISEREFREHIWPELPASRPERNLPFSYVWDELRQKSEHSLGRLLTQHEPGSLEVVRVEYAGRTTHYATFAVHRDTVLVVRDRSGAERRLRLYGSTLEKDGAFKVFSYVVEN